MVFNSLAFAIFLPVVFILYWWLFQRNLKWQNLFLLTASYFFYGWWDWRFLGLIFFSSSIDFAVGRLLCRTEEEQKRKLFLGLALTVNLLILGFFKYYNFFAESLLFSFSQFGVDLHLSTLNILLPIGISFYTFQSMGYAIDVYRKDIEASRDYVSFLAFVSFFPHMVAGPIMRAKNLLPQFYVPRKFDYAVAVSGMRLILFGLFKKVVIADNVAKFADEVFNHPVEHSGLVVIVGVLAFAIQIYCDFAGYSEMAVGIARLLGFDLIQNFRTPYFSTSLREFWQRWHIALSTWFRDYVYIPLGGNRVNEGRKYYNLFITFLISGFWHGANYTFLVWGALHGAILVVEEFIGRRTTFRLPIFFRWLITFSIVCFAWIFFRAANWNDALQIIQQLHGDWSLYSLRQVAEIVYASNTLPFILCLTVAAFFIVEMNFATKMADAWLSGKAPAVRYGFYMVCMLLILLLGINDNAPNFIYFKF